jgi:hypothetical protein
VPTLQGRELCQILANTWEFEEFLKFNCWMKERMARISNVLLALMYPRLAEYPKKG